VHGRNLSFGTEYALYKAQMMMSGGFMITKKELLIFTMSFVALVIFTLSGGKQETEQTIIFDTKEDKLLVDSIKHANGDLAIAHKKRNSKLKKDLKKFRNKLTTNNLSRSFKRAKATKKAASIKRNESKVASNKKNEAEKKEKEKEKKKVAKKDSKINPVKPLTPTSENKISKSKSKLESKDLASTTFTTNAQPLTVQANRLTGRSSAQTAANTSQQVTNKDSEDEINDDDSTSDLINTVSSVDTTKSIFTSLLEEGRFEEFEQLLQTDLTEEKRIQAYKDALNVLFSSTEEISQEYDDFIFNQFFNDKYAVIISKSLKDEAVTSEQVSYSVNYLNQIVTEWQSESGNAIFQQVYQDNVSNVLAENIDRKDFFTGLQSSIEAKSILLSENSIEVSVN